jgi:HAD superfamily hydrolase (TIGR01490 family)
MTGTAAAFFDLDRTLRATVATALVARGLGTSGRTRNLVEMAGVQATRPLRRWAGVGEPDLPQGVVLELLAGHTEDEVAAWARSIATTEVLPRVHPQVVEMIARHASSGTPTVLVTVAPRQLAAAVAATLDITHVLASEAETGPDGRFTGHAQGVPNSGPVKLAAVQALAHRESLDLARSHVYSDRDGSPELLAAVGFKHVVNPDPQTRERAVADGWAIHEIRAVHWLWALELPGVRPLAAGLAGLALGWSLHARRTRRRSQPG